MKNNIRLQLIKLLNYFISLLNNEINNKEIVKSMMFFFREHDDSINPFAICFIKVYKLKDNGLLVWVNTNKPGVFIGKAGHYIDNLTAFLSKDLGCYIKIHLEENKL